MRHEEVKDRLLANSQVREAYENPPLALALAKAVTERRKELGMTQSKLAEMMETSQAQVWRIESGSFNPTTKTISKLEDALASKFSDLYGKDAEHSPASPREQLEEWIEAELLVMTEEDLDTALDMAEEDPRALQTLMRIVEDIELEEDKCLKVTVRLEETTEESAQSHDRPRRLQLSATL